MQAPTNPIQAAAYEKLKSEYVLMIVQCLLGLLGLNMQKFLPEDGIALIGREALSDTMKDIITDGAGALVASVIGYISLKYIKGGSRRCSYAGNKMSI